MITNQVKKVLKRVPFIYRPYRWLIEIQNKLIKKRRKKALHRYGYQLLNDITEVFRQNEICICAMWGTLLGFIRDSGFIQWDDDMDFAILETKDFSWDRFEHLLNGIGMYKSREFVLSGMIKEQSYIRNDVIVDFVLYSHENQGVLTGCSFVQIPEREYHNGKTEEHTVVFIDMPIRADNIEYRVFEHAKLLIPVNAEEILEKQYGEPWRTPQKDFCGSYGREEILPVRATYFI